MKQISYTKTKVCGKERLYFADKKDEIIYRNLTGFKCLKPKHKKDLSKWDIDFIEKK